jgi:hypothetical protein
MSPNGTDIRFHEYDIVFMNGNVMSASDQRGQISITRPQTRHDSQEEWRKRKSD